jgi:hypothetical protein
LVQIKQNRVVDLLRKRQRLPPTSLPANDNTPVPPVDIGKLEMSDIAGAQPKPCQKQEHRPISQFELIVGTRVNYPLDILCDEKPWD